MGLHSIPTLDFHILAQYIIELVELYLMNKVMTNFDNSISRVMMSL